MEVSSGDGTDPYRELELYLDKVTEDFGSVFERWLGGEAKTLPRIPPVPPTRTKFNRYVVQNGQAIKTPPQQQWSTSVMPDFDAIVAKELCQLEKEIINDKPKKTDLSMGGVNVSDPDSGLETMSMKHCNTATQTSPALSRSCSFTWLSDLSSLPSSCDQSPTDTPQPSKALKKVACYQTSDNDTWEDTPLSDLGSLSSSTDIWIRRESVETQTVDPMPDLPPTADEDDEELVPPLSPNALPKINLPPHSPHSRDFPLKSTSAPLIIKNKVYPNINPKQIRSQSERHLAEMEATETCKWLRATGFPQYAQMFEDLQFPIDMVTVKDDHPFLDVNSLQSLFRRLHILNRCARIKTENLPSNLRDESDSDSACALSDHWKFQPESRRWSRVGRTTSEVFRLGFSEKGQYGSLPPRTANDSIPRFRRIGSDRFQKRNKNRLGTQTMESPNWYQTAVGSRSLPRGASLSNNTDRRNEKQKFVFRKNKEYYEDRPSSSELTEDSSGTLGSMIESDDDDGSDGNDDEDDDDSTSSQKSPLVRWHSFQRSRPLILSVFGNSPRSMSSLSTGQLLVLRKLALLKLTACMERHCPSNRTIWNWDLHRFIRKMKTPDYKDKTVFGVPLSVNSQRTGQALPTCIQAALRWLRAHALDQVGLFRKSGVRSRIQSIKVLAEKDGDDVKYDGQQAYDVADMVKQYLRELPESLFTNKLSETFISIFQHVPQDEQSDAVQWALILMPDEHREALQAVVDLLHEVCIRNRVNQMTATNLAVCLAPSLFHLHSAPTGPSTSPRRRKAVGVPDEKELGENKAARECVTHLTRDPKAAFTVSESMLASCNFSDLDASVPMSLQKLGAGMRRGWRDFMENSTHAFLTQVRDKSRGWFSFDVGGDTQVSFRKVRDGHPLRLWRAVTRIEAPPHEVLRRILRERHVWDPSLLKWRVVQRLDQEAEIFQYVCSNMQPLPNKDFCILRSWRVDADRGSCVIIETSVEDKEAVVPPGAVRGVVLASRYLIQRCGAGKSRIVHISRIDTKGRSPDWYNRSYGNVCAALLNNLRNSFQRTADGPESRV